MISLVVASERETAQTGSVQAQSGLKERKTYQKNELESSGKKRQRRLNPCTGNIFRYSVILSTAEHVKFCRKPPEPSGKAKYYQETDSEQVP